MAVADKSSKSPDTCFAPAGRDSPDELARRQTLVQHSPLLCEALNAIHDMVLILNEHRQIVAANAAALRMLGTTPADVLAKRPGEAVNCVWSKIGPDGCGTEQHCVTCGAVHAILESQQKNLQVVRECRIQVDGASGPSALDLKVAATPITVEEERFIVLAIEDISQPKRLAVLQRVFFHDVLNTAGCISGYTSYLKDNRQSIDEVCDWLLRLSDELIEEIQAQRDLMAAESGDLAVQTDMVITEQLLNELRSHYLKNPVAADRHIELGDVWAGVIWTDRRLLLRVLGNMLKNGLEATPQGQVVSVHCQDQGEAVVFAVHNPGVIPVEAQLQIFQRSFSTKGLLGRGIGTYSMKLFGERYLGGKVDFVSEEPEGTTFTLAIPKKLAEKPQPA